MSGNALSLPCERCGVPLESHPSENHHEWELRLVDRPDLTKADISEIVRYTDSRRPSVELPPPAERRAIRDDSGWTQSKVSKKLSVSRDAVGRWEKAGPGGREPRSDVARQYSDLLDSLRTENLQRAVE